MIKHVLVVEDDIAAQIVLKNMLRKIDPEVRIDGVQSAEGAFRVINDAGAGREGYDLVLADLRLPGSSGLTLWDVCSKKFPGLDFLMMSGVPYKEWFKEVERYSDLPYFLKKPVNEADLKRFWDLQFCLNGEAGA